MLVDDETGRIVYIPGFVGAQTAAAWFSALREGVAWQNERRRMYDRDVDVPRLVARYRLDDPDLPAAIAEAAERASQIASTRFNSAGLNYYRDGRDSVAPHNDHLYEIVPGHPIALISLGATRLMTIRSKQTTAPDSRPRPRERQPVIDELRNADALRSRRTEDEESGGGAHQPRAPRSSGLDADLAEVGNDALDSWVFPPSDDGRLEFGDQSQMRDVLFDRTAIGRRLLHLGMERIDRRVRVVPLGERRMKVLMRQRLAQTQERKLGLRLRYQLFARDEPGRIRIFDSFAKVAILIHSAIVPAEAMTLLYGVVEGSGVGP